MISISISTIDVIKTRLVNVSYLIKRRNTKYVLNSTTHLNEVMI